MRLATGLIFLIAGSIWILQGFDIAFAPQSFMTGQGQWVAWGTVAVLVGGVLVWRDRRSP